VLFEFAAENKLHKIGLTPYAKGRYENILSELRYYDREFPADISLFHLNRDDYALFYSCMK